MAGELFVAEFESRRLHALGLSRLSERVEHVSRTRGDGLGYDVLSFDADGRERYIEVKTTAFGQETPFYVSRNELACSDACREQSNPGHAACATAAGASQRASSSASRALAWCRCASLTWP